MTAQKKISGKAKGLAKNTVEILSRIEEYALDNPDATEYWIETEIEAEQILLAMASVIKLQIKNTPTLSSHDKAMMRNIARKYKVAVREAKAGQLFRDMTEDDQLELRGLRLRVRDWVDGEPATVLH